VHDDHLDPRPDAGEFARRLAARAAAVGPMEAEPTRWLRSWNDHAGVWTNLRNIEHWIDRAGT
jgi:hypothetical protein